MATPFHVFTEYALRITGSRSRMTQRSLIAALLNSVEPEEVALVVQLLTGRFGFHDGAERPRLPATVLWRALEPLFPVPEDAMREYAGGAGDPGAVIFALFTQAGRQNACPPDDEPLTIPDVTATLALLPSLAGIDVERDYELLVREMLCRARAEEARWIANQLFAQPPLVTREEIVLEGVALASGADPELVRRCFMVVGNVGEIARLALTEGVAALERYELSVFTPLRPMLAQTVDDLPAAWVRLGGQLALEYRLNGARVQIHCAGDEVRLYTRHLMEFTAAVPELVDAVRAGITAHSAILEGEMVAMDRNDHSLPFQELLRRLRDAGDVPQLLRQTPLKLCLFDLLQLNDEPLIDHANAERRRLLAETVQESAQLVLVPRLVPCTVEEGVSFFHRAVDDGYDGVVAKRLEGRYLPGVRGTEWLKVQEALTINLAIVGVEWGIGRRAGWISNYHLAARDIVTGELVMVGKTSKELTNQEFAEMTRALMERRAGPHGHRALVKPELVVEVSFTQLEHNRDYPDAISLCFARILRFRPDKTLDNITTLQTLRDLYTMQTGQPWTQAA